jgi:hypothetical protein
MKGFAAKIAASLESKQKVNINVLTRLMNVDMNAGSSKKSSVNFLKHLKKVYKLTKFDLD